MSSIKNVKIRVGSPENSAAIQKWLFEQGVRWVGDMSDQVAYTYKKFLYVDNRGELQHGDYESVFAEDNASELVLNVEVLTEVKYVVTPVERPKTVLFGRTYFTDELEAALATLAQASV